MEHGPGVTEGVSCFTKTLLKGMDRRARVLVVSQVLAKRHNELIDIAYLFFA